MYRFDSTGSRQQSVRAQPLQLSVILILGCSCIPLIVYGLWSRELLIDSKSFEDSPFILGLIRTLKFYRLSMQVASILILIVHHGTISNVIASNNNFISSKEQVDLAQFTFASLAVYTLTASLSFGLYISTTLRDDPTLGMKVNVFITGLVQSVLRLIVDAPLMYICYLGSALGRHVDNFSQIYIDSMFDQFMKAIEKEDEEVKSSPREVDASSLGANVMQTDRRGQVAEPTRTFLQQIRAKLGEIFARLKETRYPELPEMKMTKLSTTNKLKVTSTMKASNGRLIRLRLRKTQIMLSELRDMVGDVNKISSPLIMMSVLYQTILIVFTTTASIHMKLYTTVNLMIVPTISSTIGLLVLVVHICTSLDDTTRHLKLMINKLFDFIIMNHGSKMSSGDSSLIEMKTPNLGQEDDDLSETWSQFQYTRKLSNTIQFTMAGILPVSRRLVLPIFGHVLSAVFISIEIMSIIDTLKEQSPVHSIVDGSH